MEILEGRPWVSSLKPATDDTSKTATNTFHGSFTRKKYTLENSPHNIVQFVLFYHAIVSQVISSTSSKENSFAFRKVTTSTAKQWETRNTRKLFCEVMWHFASRVFLYYKCVSWPFHKMSAASLREQEMEKHSYERLLLIVACLLVMLKVVWYRYIWILVGVERYRYLSNDIDTWYR